MNLVERVKNILMTPKTEWDVINGETETPASLLPKYVVIMALIPAVAAFIGYGLIGVSFLGVKITGMNWGLSMAIQLFLQSILSYFICTYVIDALAPSFKSEKNLGKSAQLVAYSTTASAVAGIFYILPALSFLVILGLYGVYLFYTGIPKLKKTPQDQVVVYMIVSAVVIIVVGLVLGYILQRIMWQIFGNPYVGNLGLDNLFK